MSSKLRIGNGRPENKTNYCTLITSGDNGMTFDCAEIESEVLEKEAVKKASHAGEVELSLLDDDTVEEIEERAEQIDVVDLGEEFAEGTVVPEGQAKTWVLSELFNLRREEAAQILNVSVNTFDEHRRRINTKIEQAENTVELFGNI